MKKGIIIFIIIFICIGFFWLINNKKHSNNLLQSKNTSNNIIANRKIENKVLERSKKEITYSRVSFFHTKPVYVSLSIPSTWEGRYRLEEKGNIASFMYIGDPENVVNLFSIKLFSENEYNKNDEYIKIDSKDGYILAYKRNNASSQNSSIDKNDEFVLMNAGIDKILKSLKIFKL